MKYLITGITGFIGPHLARHLLEEGHEVFGMVRHATTHAHIEDVVPPREAKRITFLTGNVEDRESLVRIFANHRFDGVFHLAADNDGRRHFKEPMSTFMTNAVGTAYLVDALSAANPACRLVLMSTSEVYGRKEGILDELAPLDPLTPYAVSKTAADMYVRERGRSGALPACTVRSFLNAGPRRARTFAISCDAYQIARIAQGKAEPILKVGTLTSRRVILDVRDAARALLLIMKTFTSGEAYNLGGDTLWSVGELMNKMLDMTGLRDKVKHVVEPAFLRPTELPVQICNSEKLRALTGWKPEVPIEKTLRDLIDYWKTKNE